MYVWGEGKQREKPDRKGKVKEKGEESRREGELGKQEE